jgi:hypothetical protein
MRIAACLCVLAWTLAAQDEGPNKYLERPGFAWQCKTLPHFDFCFPPEMDGSHDIQAAGAAAEKSLSRMLRIAGADAYEPRIHLFMLHSSRRLEDLTGAYAAGASVPPDHAVFFVEGNSVAMVHELNHEVLTTLWGASEPWIAEGFAAFVSEPDLDGKARRLLTSGKARPLADMVNTQWNASQYPSTVIYPELGSFVKFLNKRYGAARLREIWKGGAASLPRVLGKPLENLERDWRASLLPKAG